MRLVVPAHVCDGRDDMAGYDVRDDGVFGGAPVGLLFPPSTVAVMSQWMEEEVAGRAVDRDGWDFQRTLLTAQILIKVK